MNAPEVRAELENDLTWRQDAPRFSVNDLKGRLITLQERR